MLNPFLSEISLFAFNFAPVNWAACDGRQLMIRDNEPLFTLLGYRFGGDGAGTYSLPDYRALGPQGLQYCIAVQAAYPSADGHSRDQAPSEIALLPVTFTPGGWAECNGQTLPVSQCPALYNVIGSTFGGDGQQSFGTPNLTPRAPAGSRYFIATDGDVPLPPNPFVGEVRLFPTTTTPDGWLPCDGRRIGVDQYEALFTLIGTTFARPGDTFPIPDLRQIAVPAGTQFCIATGGYFPQRP
ncbi:MAG: tail fiber protein [Gemmatimonadota bacterium]